MAPGYKRKLEDFDPNKSDSDDEDFDLDSSRPAPRSRKSRSKPRKAPKRARKDAYGDSSDDIEVESDASSEEESFQESEDEPEVNPRTGRSVRNTAKKPVKYEEDSDDDEPEDDSERDPMGPSPKKKSRTTDESLVVKLSIPSLGTQTRARTGGKSLGKRESTPRLSGGHRRSSRISQSEDEPLVALTDSGKHEVVTRAGTATPEPESGRRTSRAMKGLKKMPSAIMEASQEDSQARSRAEATERDEEDEQDVMQTFEATQEDDDPTAVPAESDDDEEPVKRGLRTSRTNREDSPQPASQNERASRRNLRQRKSGAEQSSDFEPDADADAEEDLSESDHPAKRRHASSDESQGRRSARVSKRARSQRSRSQRESGGEDEEDELDPDEIADEVADLQEDNRRNKRPRRRHEMSFEPTLRARNARPDYRVFRPELQNQLDDDDALPAVSTPQRKGRGNNTFYRSLFQTAGPFGGLGGPPPVFGGPEGHGAAGGVDSDSSEDELRGGQQGVGGAIGMTPTSAFPKPYIIPQTHNADPVQGAGGGPPGLGKVKDRKALADADPLGVDPNVGFDSVGGLDDHIDRLKEMVTLPLLYPEVFQRFHVTPPRGVLFHGPPGTGKTLLARALASSVSSEGRKVTFYMRKGADALSKWVGEAEKQLRLLFEEARKNQPSIIFFDEIDGLAPVRSSKQEQIHASIVATLLALMDGMDGRGQVIVIGATNRPDSVDPALRRPGRFDREFYFPLPSVTARRAILDIHTKGWDPPLKPEFKDQLAELTKGYGGADIRALCTEAALNAVQGTYPQIYSSDKKLVINPATIKVLAKDFMISVGKIVPSSERSAASGAAPLKPEVEPLLRKPLREIINIVDRSVPRKKKATALEEAMYDDREDALGFERETMQRNFEASRVFRPRLLIKGVQGMGQQYLGAALLSKLEGLHVQNFGLSVLLADSTRSPEAAIIQLFEEVKRHKPSIIYIPGVNTWYSTLSEAAIKTFTGLLRGLPPTEPVLVLGITDYVNDDSELNGEMVRNLFGYSMKSHFELVHPDRDARSEFFKHIMGYIRKSPLEFPDDENRKKRKLIELPVAQAPVQLIEGPSKADLKAQKKKDRQTLNMLKLNIQSVMDQIKLKYRKFRTPIIEDSTIAYLYDEQNQQQVMTLPVNDEQRQELALYRPYEIDRDEKGIQGLREAGTSKFYYNLEIVTIEKRLSNGYYKRPKDFLADIKRLAKDAKTFDDQDRILKANEMLANVEVDMTTLETTQPALVAECEAVYQRELLREHERLQKERDALQRGEIVPVVVPNVPQPTGSKSTTETTGPVILGEELAGKNGLPRVNPMGEGPSPASVRWSNAGDTSGHTNGTSVPSRPHEDSEMYDASPPYKMLQGPVPQTGTPGQRSQRSVHTQLAQGSQLDQYQNSASTTSSGHKTSDRSGRSSGPYSVNTQQSNGLRPDHPDFSTLPPTSGGSQLPDTQSSQQSGPPSPLSQSMMLPPQKPAPINALLNDPSEKTGSSSVQLILDETHFTTLHRELAFRSSGLSVEQLEQVQAALMDAIWQHRREWNRVRVSKEVEAAFNDVIKDIEQCQKLLKASQEA